MPSNSLGSDGPVICNLEDTPVVTQQPDKHLGTIRIAEKYSGYMIYVEELFDLTTLGTRLQHGGETLLGIYFGLTRSVNISPKAAQRSNNKRGRKSTR